MEREERDEFLTFPIVRPSQRRNDRMTVFRKRNIAWAGPPAPVCCAASVLLAALTSDAARAQTCVSPLDAMVGETRVQTTPGPRLDLVGRCDVSVTSPDIIYNVTWLRFDPPSAGTYAVAMCGAAFDTKLAVLTDCARPETVVACNDDAPGCLTASGLPFASRIVFTAEPGQSYRIAVGGYGIGTNGTGTLRITAETPPKTGCAAASVATSGANPFTTVDSGENLDLSGICDPGPSGDDVLHRVTWFRWTAAADGIAQASTCGGAGFDTRLAVLGSCDPASVIACNDDAPGCAGFTSQVVFPTAAGTEYWIAIGGFDAASAGAGELLILPEAPPPEACGASANACCVASAVGTPYCGDAECCSRVCAEDPFCCALDGAWDDVCALRAGVLCTSCGAGACEPAGAPDRDEPEPCGADDNSGCEHPKQRTESLVPGETIDGTYWADKDGRDVDWYAVTLAEPSTVIFELDSAGPGQLIVVDDACEPAILDFTDPYARSCPARVERCLPAGSYRVVVAMSVFSGFPCSADDPRNRYRLRFAQAPCTVQPPPNDECATAIAIPPGGGLYAFDTTLATDSSDALDSSCDEGDGLTFVRDVWFAWRPPAGPMRVSTCGLAGFDTRLQVLDACGGITVACNDDRPGCDGFTSRAEFTADGATTYLVRVGSFSGTGPGSLRLGPVVPPANDACADAVEIGEGVFALDTSDATGSGPDLDPACDEGFGTALEKDVWLAFTAPRAGELTVSTCGLASFDTRVAIHAECNGAVLACNDDAVGCPSLTSRASVRVAAGERVLIRVGGPSIDDFGRASLAVSMGGGAPPNDRCSGAVPVEPGAAMPFTNALAATDEPGGSQGGCVGAGTFGDVWFRMVAPSSGLASIDLCGGTTFDTRMELWLGCPDLGGIAVACNDDGCGLASRIEASVRCGREYWIRIGASVPGTQGTGELRVTVASGPCGDACAEDFDGNQVVDGADLGLMLGRWGQPGIGDLDGSGMVDGLDLGLWLARWGPCP